VTVLDGLVDVTAGATTHSLVPDRQLTFGVEEGEARVEEVDAASLIRWRENHLIFEDCTFNDILCSLERRFDLKVAVDPKYLTDARYRMQFVSGEPLDYILDVVHSVVGLPYKLDGKELIVGSRQNNIRKSNASR
jgi:ferric-dicitrate binding protein FerR (iron transport regulator)